MKKIIFYLILALVFVSCGKQVKDKHNTVNLEEINSEVIIPLSVGETVKVHAHTNPSTGYNWRMALPINCNVEVLKEVISPQTTEPIVGAPSELIYHVSGKRVGECTLEFFYGRAWEGLSTPKKIKFVVK